MTMTRITARATVHGAVSIVNAIATGMGSALGISLRSTADVSLSDGKGIKFQTGKSEDRLVSNIVRNVIPKNILDNNMVTVSVKSEIPIGFGLKSSSAVSNAVSLACSRLVSDNIDDYRVLDAAVRASLDAKVSITGAFDDASACYFGGFVVTDNKNRKLLKREEIDSDLYAIIFLPRSTPRGNVHRLGQLSDLFAEAFKMAQDGQYWKAMKLNGALVSCGLSTIYDPTAAAIERGAISASISGNGPATAAIVRDNKIDDVKAAFARFDGKILVSKVNNQKASVEMVEQDG